ncbi:hypothetical protein L2E82_30868 [Cichorium intybus]|uniref:Uncharacterized protein n=1 Tax=Cichorium intybus TaxID=13427 RepID=A0ACB9D1H1_CICIN|nr:hypothetical protein L2E82_30868 [Cichorium intybus]
MTGDDRTSVVVVMVPFVAHGHLNQLLCLSGFISAYGIPVHFVCTAAHLRQSRARHDGFSAYNHIHFHEFPTPPFTSPPPNSSIPFPSHLQSSFDSTLHLRRPVADLLLSLSQTATRVAVIHDALMSYVVQDVKSIPNAETYNFRPLSVFYTFWDFWEKAGRPFPVDQNLLNRLPSQNEISTPEFKKFAKLQQTHMNLDVGELFDSCRPIEGEFIEHLEREEISGRKKIWAIGPLNPVIIPSDMTPSGNLPMATWPMHSDQPRNAFLITDVLGIGVAVKEWERRKELVTAESVEEAVKTLMGSEEGEEMRRRAAKLGDDVRRSVTEGGVSRLEMDLFVSHITRPVELNRTGEV